MNKPTTDKTFKYRELESIELEELAQLMQLIKDVGISPMTLLSYAVALDTIEGAEDHDVSVEEALEMNHEAESDYGRLVDDLYSDARLILERMNKIEAH